MRVVVFEDDDTKWGVIASVLRDKGIKDTHIIRLDNVAQFVGLAGKVLDLCIIDIRMPGVSHGETRNAGLEILSMLDYSGMKKVPVLAITAFPDEADKLRASFASRGCIIYDYDLRHTWSQALDIYIVQAREKGRYDFIIFDALKKERDAFSKLDGVSIESVQRNGLDIWEFDIDGRSGAIVLLPKMGLVNAAASVARALELFSPEIVAMSGICAGLAPNAKLGQLLITETVWEYQSGKWLSEVFEAEPYQVNIPVDTRLNLSKMVDNPKLLFLLESTFEGSNRPATRSYPKLALFTTGSAVIASEKRLEHVQKQHRKVAGLDMEIYGFHRAVEMSGLKLQAFSAKVVVDMASESKGDDLHEYGCYVSASFVLKAIREMMSGKTS